MDDLNTANQSDSALKCDAEEQALLAGDFGPARQHAMEYQVDIARFFGAEDFVSVSQVHLMGDSEAVGESGVRYLEDLAAQDADLVRVRVPTITDPRGCDFEHHGRIRQGAETVELERRLSDALAKLGIVMTNTCINYQVIMPPLQGEHLAFGDTGSSIYANSVCGARTNFEGGPSAIAAALTGRVPRYGFHLDHVRRGDKLYRLKEQPRDLSEWGALGGLIGRQMTSYFETPVIDGVEAALTSDAIKHFGAAMASYGSTPLFHMVGVTPEAPDLSSAFGGNAPPDATEIDRSHIQAFLDGYETKSGGDLDVVVFAAPQLSLFEMQDLAGLLNGRQVASEVTLIAAVPATVKEQCDRTGLTAQIEDAGGLILTGVCFYQMGARELGIANDWRHLMTNSAKLTNILGGYGYEPVLASMERCVESAISGRISGATS